jgi:hypothetical protein
MVVHFDPLQRVLGGVAALCDDQRHRLAHVAHRVAGERVLRRRAELETHASLERRRSDPRLRDALEAGQIVEGEHRGQAGTGPGPLRADGREARVGVGTAEHRGVEAARRRHVVDESPAPREVARVLLAPDDGADVFRAHAAT